MGSLRGQQKHHFSLSSSPLGGTLQESKNTVFSNIPPFPPLGRAFLAPANLLWPSAVGPSGWVSPSVWIFCALQPQIPSVPHGIGRGKRGEGERETKRVFHPGQCFQLCCTYKIMHMQKNMNPRSKGGNFCMTNHLRENGTPWIRRRWSRIYNERMWNFSGLSLIYSKVPILLEEK